MADQDQQNGNGFSRKKAALGFAGVLTLVFALAQNDWQLPSFGKTDPTPFGDDPSQMIVQDSHPKDEDKKDKELPTIEWSTFKKMLESHSITQARISNSNNPEIIFKEGQSTDRRVIPPKDFDTEALLDKYKVQNYGYVNNSSETEVKNKTGGFGWGWLTSPTFMMLFTTSLFIGYLAWARHADKKNGNPMGGFGKSKAKVLEGGDIPNVTFEDVAGQDNAKTDMAEVVDFMKNPSTYKALGAKLPKGVLMIGPPGTGKTLMARAMAGEAKVPFFKISGSDFVEMFVGVGASRVRDLFAEAKKKSPCIIFIDEIDAIGTQRGAGLGSGGGDEKAQTLNQILTEMDGFEETSGIVVIAATNRPDTLDKAMIRPGRFDRKVNVDLPDLVGREQILAVHVKKRQIPVANDVDLKTVAQGTPGFSGADLEGLLNEAAMLSARNKLKTVSADMIDKAKNKILMGDEKPHLISDQEKWQIAYHEAGHTILGALNHTEDRVHMVSIMGRGRSGGVTVYLPDQDSLLTSKENLINHMESLYGGRLAEEMIFGDKKVSTGAQNDIQKVTEIARNMVTKWSLSKFGKAPLDFSEAASGGLFAHDRGFDGYNLSESLKQRIEAEVEDIAEKAYKKGQTDLKTHLGALHIVAQELFEKETIHGSFAYETLGVPLPADRPKETTPPWEIYRAKIANGNAPAPSSGVA